MRKYLLGTALVAALAGCTADMDPGSKSASATASADNDAAKPQFHRDPAHSFASLPDKGTLLAYDQTRKSRTVGAYTSRPVKISEAHALNAIAKGEMVLPGPDGQPIRLGYSSHEEHADGSWSWVGKDHDGNASVLTFGEDAVFGRIANADQVYSVTTDPTGAWLVQTDATKLVGRSGAPVGSGSDVLAAPSIGAAALNMPVAAAQAEQVETKAATIVVDVLLGYTNGLVSQVGTQSGAVTQLNQMIATANAAYVNSGINYRVRLVGTLLVNYADATDNKDALRKLTGYNEETKQSITVDSAFTALRAAREEFGADLVSLVRPHRAPEQQGCGIAWLLGADQRAISAATDAEFGYSVVSVGIDKDEDDGNSYICSEDTLVHEMGHNMGQVHNSQDAPNKGTHAYSYGYREASSTGFYTVMAYPLANSSQKSVLYFANPAISESTTGRKTGVANASDNARSMNESMPLVAKFRATKVALLHALNNDFDGDGKSDVFWRNSASGASMVWRSANYATRYDEGTVVSSAWQPVASGDFDGDGKSDIFWRNLSNGDNMVWPSGKYAQRKSLTAVRGLDWQVVGSGDFNGDGKSDIFWRNAKTGENIIWWAGVSTGYSTRTTVSAAWKVVGIGDFNGDGKADVFWRNSTNGQNIIWWSGAYEGNRVLAAVPNLEWTVVGVGDFNGDKKADVFWRNTVTGANTVWSAGLFSGNYSETAVSTQWKMVAVGDYDGDGFDDLFWRNSVTGQNILWRSGAYANRQDLTTVVTAAWQVKR